MRIADIVTAVVIFLFGVLVAVDSFGRGGGWGPDGPQPGFFPLVMAILVMGGCLWVLAKAVRGVGFAVPTPPFVYRAGIRPVLTVLVPAALMVVLTHVIGFYLASILYLVGYIRFVGGYRWRVVLPIGVLVPVAFWILFDKIFLVPMPQGALGGSLGF